MNSILEQSNREPLSGFSWLLCMLLLCTGFLFTSSCAGNRLTVTPDATRIFADALLTATFAIQVTPESTATQQLAFTPQPTLTPLPSPSSTSTPYVGTPPPLPPRFTSDVLNQNITPQTYIAETCQYMKERWDPNNSLPGTVVMAVMFHGVAKDTREINNSTDVHHSDMVIFLEHARELGFQTVTTRELVNFLEHNAKIPPRALYIVVDDRRPGVVREHFMPYLAQYGWTISLGWLIGDTDTRAASPLDCCPEETFSTLWEQMEAYNATGYLDVQAHGYTHNIPMGDSSSDEYILHEVNEPRPILQAHFYCKDYATGAAIENCMTDQPLALIWPGGGFSARAAALARQSGYHIAFTINPRGPIMYNWIPLAEKLDPNSPSWMPEIAVGDPLMVLPRYWSIDAAYHIDEVANIGEQAANYAEEHRTAEIAYYQAICLNITGEIPSLHSGE